MKLQYTIQGCGEAVILLHGLFGSGSNLGLLGRTLSSSNMIISPDLRNHGKSPQCQEMNYPCMADDIIELMDDLNIIQATLIGHSMGGKVAMQVALNHAHRVSRVIIVDISPIDYESSEHSKTIEGLNALVKTNLLSRKKADEILSFYVSDGTTRGFLLKNLFQKKDRSYGLQLFMESINSNYQSKLNLAPVGKPYMGPSLFIKGEKSPYVKNKHLGNILGLFPKAQYKTIKEAGHWLHTEKPKEFNQIVLEFLSDLK